MFSLHPHTNCCNSISKKFDIDEIQAYLSSEWSEDLHSCPQVFSRFKKVVKTSAFSVQKLIISFNVVSLDFLKSENRHIYFLFIFLSPLFFSNRSILK